MTDDAAKRERNRTRAEGYRDRRRRGAVVAWVEVERRDLSALERLGLLDAGDRDQGAIGAAVSRFLAAAGPVAVLGDSLWPPPKS